jgi:hypothetical protein
VDAYFPINTCHHPKTGLANLKNKRITMPAQNAAAQERHRKLARERKRKKGGLKKIHEIKKLCGFDVAVVVINPETRQVFTYKAIEDKAEDAIWTSFFEEMVSKHQ